ncbi:putative pectate lyase a protein [Botrytis fragariae]|uniref:pectate lyase n=1 Tax=Botrytis fragariae TaxID=1964551 RepID=A0A8H6AWD0_9HELO|nr:putative pectate lyase a protein [Botrytis fragariae]KAF5874944.1 putative pectate lyase a protein [Botrytis fragariae]
MKLSILSTGLAVLAQFVSAAPTPTEGDAIAERANIAKRAAITDVATTGFATQNGGTKGGAGGATTTVSTLAQFTTAVTNDAVARVIVVSGTISGSVQVRVGSNKTIIGKKGATLIGVGLYINKSTNVIVRNIISQKVLASNGDAIGIQAAKNVWIDHVDVSSDLNNGKDYYDGLIDVTHASDWVTISNSYIHDHFKASLIGHSDSNAAEDTGHLTVTQHNNYWSNIGSRTPSFRFGTGHVFNSYFLNANTGIDTRDGAQLLVQSNVFKNVSEPIAALYSDDTGYANAFDNNLGGYANTAPVGTLTTTSLPYSYSLLGSANVVAAVVGSAGATLAL